MAHHPGGVSPGVKWHFGPKVPEDRQDSAALVTPDSQSRKRCGGDFVQLRWPGGPPGAAPAQDSHDGHEAALAEGWRWVLTPGSGPTRWSQPRACAPEERPAWSLVHPQAGWDVGHSAGVAAT
jgi:hypothetical protein